MLFRSLNVNKSAPAATASLLMQSGASGRAEIGLTGDDDFHIKVSNDGSVWRDAISVDKDTGFVGIGTDAPATPFHVNAGLANVAFKLEGTDPTIVFQMQDDTTTSTGNGPILFARTGDNTQFYTAGSARMTIDADGQVGIGTSSPSARLNVLAGGISDVVVAVNNLHLGMIGLEFLQPLPGTVGGAVVDDDDLAPVTTAVLQHAGHAPLNIFRVAVGVEDEAVVVLAGTVQEGFNLSGGGYRGPAGP